MVHSILVVLYKCKLTDSVTLKSITSQLNGSNINTVNIIIWDNSPEYFIQEELKTIDLLKKLAKDIYYQRDFTNSSLSKVYNVVADRTFRNSDVITLTIFDHDSRLSQNYITELIRISDKKILILPQVISNKTAKIISPRYEPTIKLMFSRVISNPIVMNLNEDVSSEQFFAVGSGFTITKSLWESQLRFDENTNIYGVDKEYCTDYQKVFKSFKFINATIFHDVSHEHFESKMAIEWKYNELMQYRLYQYQKHSTVPGWIINVYFWVHKNIFHNIRMKTKF